MKTISALRSRMPHPIRPARRGSRRSCCCGFCHHDVGNLWFPNPPGRALPCTRLMRFSASKATIFGHLFRPGFASRRSARWFYQICDLIKPVCLRQTADFQIENLKTAPGCAASSPSAQLRQNEKSIPNLDAFSLRIASSFALWTLFFRMRRSQCSCFSGPGRAVCAV